MELGFYSKAALQRNFWTPYSGIKDVLVTLASPILAPVYFGLMAISYACAGLALIILAIGQLIDALRFTTYSNSEYHRANDKLQEGKEIFISGMESIFMAFAFVPLALLGPILGLISVVSRTIISIADVVTHKSDANFTLSTY
ncbi:hypothetical protein [Legionella septentrionalis]|uniref:hypothetical protein n=1 Tax=Legionella septentrionalis TaxID=2498109 RepID=UPI000F8E618B|nr:hypothetical protein [Legionella septentrionalis]RUR14816.1 hypothetical protein ELY10_07660 [Legionella septentrionalis]